MLAGSLETWLPLFRGLEERIADSVDAAWPNCIMPLKYKKDALTHEDPITDHLVRALIRTKSLPGRIVSQYELFSQDASGNVSVSGKIDFVLTVGDDEDVYVACECKRLNVTYNGRVNTLASDYVDNGVKRFVTGQYSKGLPLAMMLGYVMNAQTDRAYHSVKRAITLSSDTAGFLAERTLPNKNGRSLRICTSHACTPGHVIEISHTFLAWP